MDLQVFRYKCSLHTSSRKLLLIIIDRDHYNKLQPIKIQDSGAQSQWVDFQDPPTPNAQRTSTPKAQGTPLQKKGEKDCKSQTAGKFTLRWCLLVISEAVP